MIKQTWNYSAGNKIIHSTEILKSNLCDCIDAYILVSSDITIIGNNGTPAAFKNCLLFTRCIKKIDETTIDDADDLDLVMLMYNLIEYSSNFSDLISSTWHDSKDEATRFNTDINTDAFKSFKYKAKLLGNTVAQTTANADNGILENLNLCTIKLCK